MVTCSWQNFSAIFVILILLESNIIVVIECLLKCVFFAQRCHGSDVFYCFWWNLKFAWKWKGLHVRSDKTENECVQSGEYAFHSLVSSMWLFFLNELNCSPCPKGGKARNWSPFRLLQLPFCLLCLHPWQFCPAPFHWWQWGAGKTPRRRQASNQIWKQSSEKLPYCRTLVSLWPVVALLPGIKATRCFQLFSLFVEQTSGRTEKAR